MKRKILTMMLCCTMAFSLAACGGKQEEPVNTEVNEQSDEKEEENIKSAEEEPTPEPEVEEPEQVELTADTIDKYFGFEYADVADDAITGFSFTNDADYGNSVIEIGSLPAAYTDTTAPDLTQVQRDDCNFGTSTAEFVPYTWLLSSQGWVSFGKYTILEDEIAVYGTVDSDHSLAYRGGEFAVQIAQYIKDKNIPGVGLHVDTYAGVDMGSFALLAPSEILDTIPANGADLLIYNNSDDFVSAMDGSFVGFQMNFGQMDLTVAGDITAESTIEDVVAKYEPSTGTIADNGMIVLTWNTTSGTVVEMSFSAEEHKAMSVKMLSADMPADIFETLHY